MCNDFPTLKNLSHRFYLCNLWHLIDFVIVKQRDIHNVRMTCAMHSTECWTDHRLVRSILKLHIAPTQCKHPKVIRSPFNMATLRGFGEYLMRSSRPVHPMLKKALGSGASLRGSSLKQQKLSWVLKNMQIKTGSMRTMSASLSCYMQRTRHMWSGKMIQAPNPSQTNSDISEDKPRRYCAR